MYLRFRATRIHTDHLANDFYIKDGDVLEVEKKRGEELLKDFPKNFEEIDEATYKKLVKEKEAELVKAKQESKKSFKKNQKDKAVKAEQGETK